MRSAIVVAIINLIFSISANAYMCEDPPMLETIKKSPIIISGMLLDSSGIRRGDKIKKTQSAKNIRRRGSLYKEVSLRIKVNRVLKNINKIPIKTSSIYHIKYLSGYMKIGLYANERYILAIKNVKNKQLELITTHACDGWGWDIDQIDKVVKSIRSGVK